jgi:hypothetical protein
MISAMTSARKALNAQRVAAVLAALGLLLFVPVQSPADTDPTEAPQSMPASGRRIAVGDSVERVRQVLGDATPIVPVSSIHQGEKVLIRRDLGLMVFFNIKDQVDALRLGAPFAAAAYGARIGESRQALLQELGSPAKTLPRESTPGNGAYIYHFDSNITIRYDFGDDDRLKTILIISGSVDVQSAGARTADTAVSNAIRDAHELVECEKNLDGQCVTNWISIETFRRLGLDAATATRTTQATFNLLKATNATFLRFDLGPPGQPFSGHQGMYLFIPYTEVITAAGKQSTQTAFFIGISEDQGATWKFMDGIGITEDNIRAVIPDYAGGALPPKSRKP